VCNAVNKDGNITDDWGKSWPASVYKSKRDALECGLFQGIKLLEHLFKISEKNY